MCTHIPMAPINPPMFPELTCPLPPGICRHLQSHDYSMPILCWNKQLPAHCLFLASIIICTHFPLDPQTLVSEGTCTTMATNHPGLDRQLQSHKHCPTLHVLTHCPWIISVGICTHMPTIPLWPLQAPVLTCPLPISVPLQ